MVRDYKNEVGREKGSGPESNRVVIGEALLDDPNAMGVLHRMDKGNAVAEKGGSPGLDTPGHLESDREKNQELGLLLHGQDGGSEDSVHRGDSEQSDDLGITTQGEFGNGVSDKVSKGSSNSGRGSSRLERELRRLGTK